MSTRLRRVILLGLGVLALTFAWAGSARAVTIAPPWCGTPEPDAAGALPDGSNPTDPPGSFAHIPYYAIGCTLDAIQAESLDGRMSVQVFGHSAGGRPMYLVTINQLVTHDQQKDFQNWEKIRGDALTDPAKAQTRLGKKSDFKIPIFIQSAIHGNEYEGVDAMMLLINRLATTPYGTDPEVDRILDHAIVVFNTDQNPDGRAAGTRTNSNGFDLNRDFLTQSQPEVQASVSVMQKWLFPDMLDQHGYATPTLIEATTKPHNPGIDYDLWLKWNQPRTLANKVALAGVDMGAQRPVNEWCADADLPPIGTTTCADGSTPGPAVAEGWDDWGPFYTPMYNQLVGLNGSTVEMCSSTATNPATQRVCGAPGLTTFPRGRLASRLAQYTVATSTLAFDIANRDDLMHDMLEIYRRGVAGEPRPPCCPPPFDVENNWMRDYPTAYVIPLGATQRSDPEANRLVRWLSDERDRGLAAGEGRHARLADLPGRLVRGLDGPAPPRAGRDRARDRRRHLLPDQRALRPARGLEPRLPLGSQRGHDPTRERTSRRRPSPSARRRRSAAASWGRATATPSRSTRRPPSGP